MSPSPSLSVLTATPPPPRRWMSVSAEHLVVLIIVVALVVKYVLFEAPDAEQIRLKVQAEDQAMCEYPPPPPPQCVPAGAGRMMHSIVRRLMCVLAS